MNGFARSLLSGALLAMAASAPWPAAAQEVYQTPRAFLSEAFPDQIPLAQPFEITDEVRAEAGRILGHSFGVDRVNYWREGARTVWILEEIGRYRPITTGLIVSDGAIEQVKVLIFRESHGWEVRHEFFTDQFIGLRLDNEHQLTANIDGISGATLSVNALRALARLALYFDKTVRAD